MKLKITVIVFFLCLLGIAGQGQTKRVLFIGNSYTLNNNLPKITSDVAASAGDQLIYSTSAYASYSLQLHSQDANTLGLIRQGGWDYVVLQEYSQYPSEPLTWVQANVFPYVQYLNNEINSYSAGVETMFYMTWGRRDGDAERCSRLPEVCTYEGMDNLTRDRYMMMAQNYDGVVSPVGAVWRYLRQYYPSIELYDADGSHPSQAGSYAGACCFYTAIFRKDPTLITYNYTLSSTDASIIRNAVREVVYNNLSTWYLQPVINNYTIYASAGQGGSINPSGTQYVSPGSGITFNISPQIGYSINDVRVDNISVGAVSTYTFSSVSANHTISATFTSPSYTITSSAGSGGSISPSGSQTVTQGSSITFNINPQSGYFIYDVSVDNVSVGAVSSYTFGSVSANHTIAATFRSSTYTITSSAGSGGSINPSGSTTVNYGSNRTYTITPSAGYRISDVRVDNVSVGAANSYTFNNITANHSITAAFSIITFTVNSSAGTGGTISPAGATTVNYGTDRTFTINPGTGYYIADVKVDDVSVGPVSSYTFRNITSDHTIAASFSRLRYSVTATSGSGGSITPSGTTTLDYGSDITFNITPSTGYRIADVRIDNVSAGAIPSYTFSGITSNHSITASFAIITFNIASGAGSGGTITPLGTTIVNYGSSQAYTVTPSTGFNISDVKVDNSSAGPLSEYVFSNIVGNHSITASFSIKTFIISSGSNQGGTVSPSGNTNVNYGTSITLTFVPDYGFRIKDIIVDGASKGKITSFTLNNIVAGHTVSAVFEPIPVYTISVVTKTGGSVTPSGSTEIFEGSDLTCNIEPDSGYRILDVKVDNKSVGAIQEYTFVNITSDHVLTATFTTNSEIRIYPNPFSDVLNIKISSPEGYKFDLDISDLTGRTVYRQKDIPGNEQTPVVFNGREGPYFARVFLNGKRLAAFKLLKTGR
jgi:hypothetical protein